MATEAKRLKVAEGLGLTPLQAFLSWCSDVGLELSKKVCVCEQGSVAGYGMMAVEEVEEGEVLFTIPRSALLHQGTSKVSDLLERERDSLQSESGWVPLLLALQYEYTSPWSHWSPYLSLWKDFSAVDQPMFWSKEEREGLLRGTGVPEAVEKDLANIQKEYNHTVLPFIRKYPEFWSPDTHTLELYTQLVAFIMAYSFQEPVEQNSDDEDDEEEMPNPPMMVPMADMLNHVSNHNANLEYMQDCLKMRSVRAIPKGQEVFNTYGPMANWQLLHMYGFTETYTSNNNDTIDITMATLYKAASQGVTSDLWDRKWKVLCQTLGEKCVFILGQQGFLTDEELHTSLKVLCMSESELQEFQENDGWEEEEEDEEWASRTFSNEGLPGLQSSWRQLLHDAARLSLDSYRDPGARGKDGGERGGGQGDLDQVLMDSEDARAALSSRQQRALQLRYGQKRLLRRLLELTRA